MAGNTDKENITSGKKLSNRLGLAGAIGALMGIGAEKVAEVGFKAFELKVKSNQFDTQMLAKNVERVIELWNSETLEELPLSTLKNKTAFTGVLIESNLVPNNSMCAVTALALENTPTKQKSKISQIFINTISRDKISMYMTKDSCNLYEYEQTTLSAVDVIPPNDKQPIKPTLSCPKGLLYTQFGKQEQIAFGNKIKIDEGSYEITRPEVINGFNADKIVIRYFSKDSESLANDWAQFLMNTNEKKHINTKYFKGFENINPEQFELWWPANIDTPNEWQNPKCE